MFQCLDGFKKWSRPRSFPQNSQHSHWQFEVLQARLKATLDTSEYSPVLHGLIQSCSGPEGWKAFKFRACLYLKLYTLSTSAWSFSHTNQNLPNFSLPGRSFEGLLCDEPGGFSLHILE